ncbi:PQQ-binding-like beta-propeller repeat protein [Halorubrum sp. BV1]|uniref:PQQ-binding-like beta-propeller repeat protein n=1 Tax=Halorubrum sp. BV1 TaxID=1498500 RepID=UPI0006790970|nr:PQQ-binding-like beta-propeller repeat protein [Halorubrum sp. BV1]
MDRRVLFASLILFAGGAAGVGVALFAFVGVDDGATEAEIVWESDPVTGDDGSGAVVATMDGDPLVLQSVAANGTRSVRATAVGGGVEWTSPVGTGAGGGAAPADGDGGEAVEAAETSGLVTGTLGGEQVVALTTRSGSLVVFDADDGSERFVVDTGGRSAVRPAIGDVDGDGDAEVVAVSTSGGVLAVDAGGDPVFQSDVGAPIERRPLAIDFSGNKASGDDVTNGVAVVTADGDEHAVRLLDGDGDVRWTATPSVTPLSWRQADSQNGPILALGGTNGNLETLEVADGSTRYEIGLQDLPVAVGDAGPGRVYVGGSGSVWAVSLLDGEVSWKQQFGGDTRVNAPSLGVLGGGDEADPVAINREGDLLVLNRNGGVTARGSVGAVVYASPQFADVTGDGTDELIVVTEDGTAVAVDVSD